MIKIIFFLSMFVAILCQQYELMNNLVDFDDTSYQTVSLPYPYQDGRERQIGHVRSEPIKNAILFDNGFEVVKPIAKETGEVKTSLSNINTSLISTIGAVGAKILGGLKVALKLLILKLPALILGAIMAIGFCKVTSVCTKFNSIQSLTEAQELFSSYITPDTLDMASEYVQEAIRRYRSIQ